MWSTIFKSGLWLTSRQSRRHMGALVGLASPNIAPSPQNRNMKHYKLVEFLSNLNVKPPLQQRKAPTHT